MRGEDKTGTLTLTLTLPDDTTAELRATGRFDGNTYTGRFQAVAGERPVGGGTVRLERR